MSESFTKVDHKQIISQILQDWEKHDLPPIKKDKLNLKLLPFRRTGQHSLINIMILSDNQPILVIKVPRFKAGALAFKAIENEAKMLKYLADKNIFNEHVPKLLKLLHIENIPILLTKAYQGEMLHHFLDKEDNLAKLEEYMIGGAELLLLLYNKKESQQQTIDQAFIKKQVKDPLKQIANSYPQYINDVNKFVESFLKDKDFSKIKFPSVCFHAEFNPWNLLRERNGNLIILDWEDAAIQGLPLLDLYNYFTVCFRIVFVGESEQAQKRSIEEKKKRAELVLKIYAIFADKYCKSLNIPLKLKDLFYIIFAINTTSFFINEKRGETEYGKSWLSLLLNTDFPDCFQNHLKTEIELYRRSQKS